MLYVFSIQGHWYKSHADWYYISMCHVVYRATDGSCRLEFMCITGIQGHWNNHADWYLMCICYSCNPWLPPNTLNIIYHSHIYLCFSMLLTPNRGCRQNREPRLGVSKNTSSNSITRDRVSTRSSPSVHVNLMPHVD